ncbi:MAG: PilZ domain-containing protein [Pirellulaceae bacterium]
MWVSSAKKKQVTLNRAMGRIINQTFSYGHEVEADGQRSESRNRRNLPCLVFRTDEQDAGVAGITLDMSLQGLSFYSSKPLEPGAYLIIVRSNQETLALKGECLHCQAQPLGAYYSGFALTEVMEPKDNEDLFQAIESYDAERIAVRSKQ